MPLLPVLRAGVTTIVGVVAAVGGYYVSGSILSRVHSLGYGNSLAAVAVTMLAADAVATWGVGRLLFGRGRLLHTAAGTLIGAALGFGLAWFVTSSSELRPFFNTAANPASLVGWATFVLLPFVGSSIAFEWSNYDARVQPAAAIAPSVAVTSRGTVTPGIVGVF